MLLEILAECFLINCEICVKIRAIFVEMSECAWGLFLCRTVYVVRRTLQYCADFRHRLLLLRSQLYRLWWSSNCQIVIDIYGRSLCCIFDVETSVMSSPVGTWCLKSSYWQWIPSCLYLSTSVCVGKFTVENHASEWVSAWLVLSILLWSFYNGQFHFLTWL